MNKNGDNIGDRIIKSVYAWNGWSRAERRRMAEVAEEVLRHCIDGTGNRFVAQWCERYLDKRGCLKGAAPRDMFGNDLSKVDSFGTPRG
jgi:hypothetical protein